MIFLSNITRNPSPPSIQTMEVAMTTTTRRAILAGAAALPAMSLPVIAAETDPIFAAIDNARSTRMEYEAVNTISAEMFSDDQRHDAAEAKTDRASAAMWKAQRALFETVPTTTAGVIALVGQVEEILQFYRCPPGHGCWNFLTGDGDEDKTDIGNLLASIVTFLRARGPVEA
jgi:hypothetical protein